VIGMITALGDVEAARPVRALHSGAINEPLTLRGASPPPVLGGPPSRPRASRLIVTPALGHVRAPPIERETARG
jgi:hypothetical protein